MSASGLVLLKETIMPQSNRDPSTAETGERVPTRPHDSGSHANSQGRFERLTYRRMFEIALNS